MQILGKWQNIGEKRNIEIHSSAFLDIIVPSKCAKFGEDRLRNGGTTTFFGFCMGPYGAGLPWV